MPPAKIANTLKSGYFLYLQERMIDMEGYVFKKGNSYLTKARFWYQHDNITDAYVFSPQEAAEIILMAENWGDSKPTEIIRCTYDG
jgi:hypothetical protein